MKIKKESHQNQLRKCFSQSTLKHGFICQEPAPISESAPKLTESNDVICIENESAEPETVISEPISQSAPVAAEPPTEVNASVITPTKITRRRPAQEAAKKKINILRERIIKMQSAKDASLLSTKQKLELKQLRKELSSEEMKLRRLKQWVKGSKNHYKKERIFLKTLSKDPLSKVKIQDHPGRPPLDRDQPDLQDSILEIINSHCSAEERRRSECLRSMKTLDDLLFALQEKV